VPRPASVHRELTGLDASLVAFHRGRIDANTYAHDLFRDDYKILDRYDGTQASDDPAPESEVLVTFDRSLIVLNGVLSGPFLDYLDNTLGYQTGRRYNMLNLEVNVAWNRAAPLGTPDDLAYALTLNHDLKALVVHGYHDLITPYFLSRYLLEQSVVSDTARRRLYFGTYRGGHMFYLYDENRAELFRDVSGFYAN
jgi:carboxypeptidase C (cathepsin A)